MKFFRFLASLSLVAGMFCMAACSDDEDTVSGGNNDNGGNEPSSGTGETTDGITLYPNTPDTITLTSEEGATATVRMRCYCGWTTAVECYDSEGSSTSAWFSVSPSSGEGGSDWPTITLTANRNSGDVRTGVLYLIPESGDEVSLKVEQEDGFLSASVSGISGILAGTKESSAYISLSYRNASAGDALSVETELGGASEGLSVDTYSATLSVGSGTVEIPISGTPTSAGTLTAYVKVTVNGEERAYTNLTAPVYVLYQGFENFNWGGDYVGVQPGLMPEGSGNGNVVTGLEWTGLEPGVVECNWNQHATNRMFDPNCYSDGFLENVGLGGGWSGSCNYMFHNQVLTGNANEESWLTTPELEVLPSSGASITVSADVCWFMISSSPHLLYIQVAKKGDDDFEDLKLFTSSEIPVQEASHELKWTTISVTANNVTDVSKVRLYCIEASQVLINNICIALNEE